MGVECDEKNWNILQGGIPKKIFKQKDSFGAFWCIQINYKNGSRTPQKTEISYNTENSHACLILTPVIHHRPIN